MAIINNNLKFLRGLQDNLYEKNQDGTISNIFKNFDPGSFLLTTDGNNFYYVSENNELKILSNPHETIKNIYSYYYNEINPTETPLIPTTYPPDSNLWSLEVPSHTEGDKIYKINCIVFVGENFSYLNLESCISYEDIDDIVAKDFGTALLGQAVVGYAMLDSI